MYVSKDVPTAPPIPGLEEAIQRSQAARDAGGASPTGAPKVKPTQVPWLLGVMVGAVAGLEVCASSVPDETVQLGCRIGAVALAGVLGTVSPGWRSRPQ